MGVSIPVGQRVDEIAGALKIMAQKEVNVIRDAATWKDLPGIVNSGIAPLVLPVGTQITDEWTENEGGIALDAVWDVVHHNSNGMYLNWHYALPTGVPFDAPEAIYYADGSEAAGTYYIQIAADYGTGWVTGQCIQITTAVAMSAGDKLYINCGTNNANNPTAGRAWQLLSSDGLTVKDSGTTSLGASGTKLGDIGTDGTSKTNGRVNSMVRVVYGYNRWSQSAIRQYLNSDAAANAWWASQNAWDMPPAVLSTLRGHLAGYSAEFRETIQTIEITTALNTVEGHEEASETTRDKIFLPSIQEWNCNPQWSGEGEEWDYYVKLARAIGVTGYFGTGSANAHAELIKYRLDSKSSPVYVWCRSANRGYATYAWSVISSGYFNGYYAYIAHRGCPACVIQKSV